MNLDFYFPTPIWWTDLNIDNNFVLDYCYQKRKENPVGRQLSNRGGWQSEELPIKDDLIELTDRIMDSSVRTLDDYGFESNKTSIFFGNSWININKGSDTNQIHTHHGSFLSGVYYVKANENSGNIFFYRDFDQNFITTSYAKVTNHTSISSGVVFYPPKTGRLIVFPSNLLHAVDSNRDDEDRISIAFNIGIKYD
jgi:uncharacterized protein (TIGR02466 family)